MPLVNMHDMLYHAYNNNYAVGAFDLVSLDFLEAVIEAAESCRSSIILSIAEPHFAHYDMELMLPAVEAAAKRASIPVAIQLDHSSSLESAIKAINLGCNGVMLDASHLPLPENIEATKSVVEAAHTCGIAVIGEIGYVAGIEGEGAELHPGEASLTVPAEAKAYVERTGVDFLAVSIGTTQGRMKSRAKLDFKRLKILNQMLNVPLVIHGGSGLNETQFRKLTDLGVAKINYYTALSDVAADTMRQQFKSNPKGSFTKLKQGVKQAVSEEVKRCIRLWGSTGRAAEVLAQCKPWLIAEHVIIHNFVQLEEQQVNRLMAEGREILLTIAGVRGVFTGKAIKEGDKYSCCWIIHLNSQQNIDVLYQHPAYMNFSKNILRIPNTENLLDSNYLEISF